MNNVSKKTQSMVLTAIFAAIIIVMSFVPNLGYINLVIMKATLIHVPVIIGSILLGPKQGAILGFVFGLSSLINATFNPTPASFAFSPFYQVGEIGGNIWSIVICFVPRILVGVIPYFVFHGIMNLLRKKKSVEIPALAIAGLAGSMTNTLLVMNLIYVFFIDQYMAIQPVGAKTGYALILSIILGNGIPEAIVAAVVTALVCKVMLHLHLRN